MDSFFSVFYFVVAVALLPLLPLLANRHYIHGAMVLDSIYDIDNERQIEEAKEEDETHIIMHTYRTIPKEHVLPLLPARAAWALSLSRSLNMYFEFYGRECDPLNMM